MVKLISRIFSAISGSHQRADTTYQTRRSGIVLEQRPAPTGAPSEAQTTARTIFRAVADDWNALSPAEQEQYRAAAGPHGLTGYQYYLHLKIPGYTLKWTPPVTAGLTLHLPYDNLSGGQVIDLTGNTTATYSGAVPVPDPAGTDPGGLHFDGIDDYAQLNSAPPGDARTIILFFRPDENITAAGRSQNLLNDTDTAQAIRLGNISSAIPSEVIALYNAGGSSYSTQTITAGQLYMLAYRYNGTNYDCLIDGSPVTTTQYAGGAALLAQAPWLIGNYIAGASDYAYAGDIYETLTYNRALSDAEIAEIHTSYQDYIS